jgi:hypothetical protein
LSHSYTEPSEPTAHRSWATGIALFAGVVLLSSGVFQVAQGFAAVHNDKIYGNVDDYLYKTDLSVWGWVHVCLGVIAIVVGVSIIARKRWAIGFGIVIASISAFANFLFLPQYPLWSILVIAFDVAAIWALSDLFDR